MVIVNNSVVNELKTLSMLTQSLDIGLVYTYNLDNGINGKQTQKYSYPRINTGLVKQTSKNKQYIHKYMTSPRIRQIGSNKISEILT